MDLEKNVQRVEIMVFQTCGCDLPEGIIVLSKALDNTNKKWQIQRNKFFKKTKEKLEDN